MSDRTIINKMKDLFTDFRKLVNMQEVNLNKSKPKYRPYFVGGGLTKGVKHDFVRKFAYNDDSFVFLFEGDLKGKCNIRLVAETSHFKFDTDYLDSLDFKKNFKNMIRYAEKTLEIEGEVDVFRIVPSFFKPDMNKKSIKQIVEEKFNMNSYLEGKKKELSTIKEKLKINNKLKINVDEEFANSKEYINYRELLAKVELAKKKLEEKKIKAYKKVNEENQLLKVKDKKIHKQYLNKIEEIKKYLKTVDISGIQKDNYIKELKNKIYEK